MKFLYKYPQAEFPYEQLVRREPASQRARARSIELLDTGIFDDDRYFDIFIEYAKIDAEDMLIRIEAFNRGPEPAPLHILPHLWFRNTWAWTQSARPRPVITPRTDRAVSWLSLRSDDSRPGDDELSAGPLSTWAANALWPRRRHAAVHRQRNATPSASLATGIVSASAATSRTRSIAS